MAKRACLPCQRGDCVDHPDSCINPANCACVCGDDEALNREVFGPWEPVDLDDLRRG